MAVAKWTAWVEAMRPDGTAERIEIAVIERDLSSPGPDDLGLRLTEAKDLLRDPAVASLARSVRWSRKTGQVAKRESRP
jgi:hypothetical protein